MQAGGQVLYKRGGLGKSTSMMMIMKIIMIFMIIITTLIMMIIAISTILMKIYHGVVVHDYHDADYFKDNHFYHSVIVPAKCGDDNLNLSTTQGFSQHKGGAAPVVQ